MLTTALLLFSQVPSVQEAIDAARPNGVVEITPEMDWSTTAIISRPVALVGAGWQSRPSVPDADGNVLPAIHLNGPGSGSVALWNIRLGGAFQPPCDGDAPCEAVTAPCITGGGFEMLALFGCDIQAPQVATDPPHWRTSGADGLAVTRTDLVLIVDSQVRASSGRAWYECVWTTPPTAGVDAPQSHVEAYDSLIQGGGQETLCWVDASCPLLPRTLPPYRTAGAALGRDLAPVLSGPGVRARSLNPVSSAILGAPAPFWVRGWDALPEASEGCGRGWPGVAFESTAPAGAGPRAVRRP